MSEISDDNQKGSEGRVLAAPLLFETEAGLVVVQDGRVLASQPSNKKTPDRLKDVAKLGEKARGLGVRVIGVADREAAGVLEGMGFETVLASEVQMEALGADRLGIMVRAGFASDEAAAVEIVRGSAIAAAEEKISEESSREDLHLVHAIQGLDELDRFLNITTERVAEWYGLHFPELQDLIADYVALAKLIVETGGKRANFDEEKLQGKGFSDKKIEAILTAAERSKGGSATERDMNRTIALAEVGLAVAAEREKLAEYVESTMKKIAPNTTRKTAADDQDFVRHESRNQDSVSRIQESEARSPKEVGSAKSPMGRKKKARWRKNKSYSHCLRPARVKTGALELDVQLQFRCPRQLAGGGR